MPLTLPPSPGGCVYSAFHDRRYRFIAVGLVLLKLWFVTAQPVNPVPGSGHDDQLFLQHAEHLLRGEWLGPYSQYTLMKGCGYPVFIALMLLLGVPLPLGEHLLYLLGCWLLMRAIRPLLPSDRWSLASFALLAWQPMSYTIDRTGGTILRQNLYTPLALLAFAGLIALHTRRDSAALVRTGWAALLGTSLGWIWLTREESIWIAPSVVLLATVALVASRREGMAWRRLAGPPFVALGTALAPVLVVCALNAKHYQWFGTVEVRAPEFVAAYGALNRVRVGAPREQYPLLRADRLAVYDASPTFARLQPYLEGDVGRAWTMGNPEQEIHGAMWIWALRDAVMLATNADNAGTVLRFYQQIAQEVNAACDRGQLPSSRPRRDTLLPAWHPALTRRMSSEFPGYLRTFLLFDRFNARPGRSPGTAEQLKIFRDLTQWHLAPPDRALELRTPRSHALRVWRIGALHDIGRLLRWVCVGAVASGLVAWAALPFVCLRRRAWPPPLWWFATAALGGAMAVWTISFLVHVTSWSDTRPLRFAQAYPLLIVFAMIAAAAAANALRRSRAALVSPAVPPGA